MENGLQRTGADIGRVGGYQGGNDTLARKPSGVFSSLAKQQELINHLGDTFGRLYNRLDPVLSSNELEKDVDGPRRSGDSDIERLILTNNDTIALIINGVERTISRLEI